MFNLRRGEILVLTAFIAFGLAPVYWKQLHGIAPELVLLHRTFWSLVVLTLLLAHKGRLRSAMALFRNSEQVKAVTFSSLLIGLNWLTYLHALKEGKLAEASLGYFLSPLLTIALGAFFFKERLSPAQLSGVFLLASGVILRALALGALPWYAIVLAVSFSLYALTRKYADIRAEEGMFAEMALLLPLAVAYTHFTVPADVSYLVGPSAFETLLLYASGLVTAIPMVWYIAGAKEVSVRFLGVFNYISPTLYLVLAVVLYGEPFHAADAMSFALIWLGIAVFLAENLIVHRRLARTVAGSA